MLSAEDGREHSQDGASCMSKLNIHNDWLPLDNAAKIYPSTASVKSPAEFRIFARLNAPVRLAFLQQASQRPVPASVAGQLHVWAGRFDQVRLEEMVLVTVKSERALREISALPQTRSLIGQILSPTTALVSRNHLPRLRKELRALGYLSPPPSDSGRGSGDDVPERG